MVEIWGHFNFFFVFSKIYFLIFGLLDQITWHGGSGRWPWWSQGGGSGERDGGNGGDDWISGWWVTLKKIEKKFGSIHVFAIKIFLHDFFSQLKS